MVTLLNGLEIVRADTAKGPQLLLCTFGDEHPGVGQAVSTMAFHREWATMGGGGLVEGTVHGTCPHQVLNTCLFSVSAEPWKGCESVPDRWSLGHPQLCKDEDVA